MEEENKGVSIGEIFRVIFSKKILALIIALAVTVAGTLLMYFLYNSLKMNYETEFSMILPDLEDKEYYTFPDGSIMHYAEMVSYEELEAVKNSSEDFKNIDVESMVSSGEINISRNQVITKVNELESSTVTYVIRVKSSYFKDSYQAAAFMRAVCSRPVEKYAQTEPNHYVYLDMSKDADDYQREISLLSSQLNYILNEYEALVRTHGADFIAEGRTLKTYVDEINFYKNKNRLSILNNKVKQEYLLKNEAVLEEYSLNLFNLERQLTIANDTLTQLLNLMNSDTGTSFTDGASVIKSQRDTIGNLEVQIEDAKKFLEYKNVDPTFETEYIQPEYDAIKEYTDTLKKVVTEVYGKTATVSFMNVNGIVTSGGIGLMMSGALSFIVGVILACIVAYIAGRVSKNKKIARNAEVTVFPEAAAQIAVTDDAEEKDNEKDEK